MAEKNCKLCFRYDVCYAVGRMLERAETCSKYAPDVAEVKHGHFVRNERNTPKMREFHKKGIALSMSEKSIFWTCSCCGSWASPNQKYCSECGAKMDEGNAE